MPSVLAIFAADHGQMHGFPENGVRVHIDEQKQIALNFAAFLFSAQIFYPASQTPRVADVRIRVGGHNRDAFPLIGVFKRVKRRFIGQAGDNCAKGVKTARTNNKGKAP